jgi:riboflavin synthase
MISLCFVGNYLFAAFLAGTGMRASKLMSYGIIISALLTQLAYAKVLVGEEEEEDKDKENKSLEPPVRSQDSQDTHDSQ